MLNKKVKPTFFKVIAIGAVLSLVASSPARAYSLIGKIWTSTSSSKYPTVFTGSLSSSLLSTASSMNQKWGGLQGSALQTGNLFVTSSLTVYENAAFTMWMEDSYLAYGTTAPATTSTCAGCNIARVTLNTHWIWSNQFLDTPNNANSFGYVDSATVILHELGHAYGLAHPQSPLSAAEIVSVMYANKTIKRTPASDDISGIASMY
jgi:hypothetical protein